MEGKLQVKFHQNPVQFDVEKESGTFRFLPVDLVFNSFLQSILVVDIIRNTWVKFHLNWVRDIREVV